MIRKFLLLFCMLASATLLQARNQWPDGSAIDKWFNDTTWRNLDQLPQYVVTSYGVKTDSTLMQTTALQHVIDLAARQGGGVVVIPRGTFLSGSLFFRQGTHLLLQQGAKLKGSDRIGDYPIVTTRIEGQTCKYFAALINADHLDGFTISGPGAIDGNGYYYWQEFWLRRKWNPQCTNKEAQRPRLVFMSHCTNVTLQGVKLQNSAFWTSHFYRTSHLRCLDCRFTAPTTGDVKAPSSDAIDLDVCHDVLINNCFMSVNDDAVVMKGGKGTWADRDTCNGANYNVLVRGCTYLRTAAFLTCGSESIGNRNIIVTNCRGEAHRLLWLKMRPDTPQQYSYITVVNCQAKAGSMLQMTPWTQFYQKDDRPDMPRSRCSHITLTGITGKFDKVLNVKNNLPDFFDRDNFTLKDIRATSPQTAPEWQALGTGCTLKNIYINNQKVK